MESESENLRCVVRSLRTTDSKISKRSAAVRAFAPPYESPWNDANTFSKTQYKHDSFTMRVLSAAAGERLLRRAETHGRRLLAMPQVRLSRGVQKQSAVSKGNQP